MYDISLSYMMYLPVSHSIPLTIILRSAFCVLHSAFCVLQNTPAVQQSLKTVYIVYNRGLEPRLRKTILKKLTHPVCIARFCYSCHPGETVVYLPYLGIDLIFVRTIISRENNHGGQWGSFEYYWR